MYHVMTVGRGLGTVPGKVDEERDICMMLLCGLGTWLLANKVLGMWLLRVRLLGTRLLGMRLLGMRLLGMRLLANTGCSEQGY